MDGLFNFAKESDDEHWISVSDLMAGLMIIFLFIAISLVLEPDGIGDRITDSLKEEFKEELDPESSNSEWKAELNGLNFRFKEPEKYIEVVSNYEKKLERVDVFFEAGEAILKTEFQNILEDFIPRYMKILNQHRSDIAEVRIEGHTSSEWDENASEEEAYFANMALSQSRTRSVLKYTLQDTDIKEEDKNWLREKLTANGLSSSELVKDEATGKEDDVASRRVEFEVRIKSIDISSDGNS